MLTLKDIVDGRKESVRAHSSIGGIANSNRNPWPNASHNPRITGSIDSRIPHVDPKIEDGQDKQNDGCRPNQESCLQVTKQPHSQRHVS